MGGSATFKHVYAVVTHSTVIVALQQVFSVALSYASGKAAGANLGIFVPTLDETNFVTLFLGSIDLFLVWATFSLAIGLGVLYQRRTGPIAMTLLGLYFVIALVIAYFRFGFVGDSMTRKKVLIIIGVVILLAAVVGANLYFRRDRG